MAGRFCWRCGQPLPAPPPTSCPHCGQEHYANPAPGGEAVIVRNGQVLLVRRAAEPGAGAWDVPGGFCDGDEHPMHAAERELEEELGVRGRATAYIGTWIDVYGPPDPDGLQRHIVASAYLMALTDPAAELRPEPAEVLEAGWFGLRDLPEPLAFPAHVRPMLAAAADLVQGTARPLPDRTW